MNETFYEVKNPTKEDITIMVKGVNYTLPSEGELKNVPEFVAKHWESLHAFLKFKKMGKVTEQIVVEQKGDIGFVPTVEIVKEITPEVIVEPTKDVEPIVTEPKVETVVPKETPVAPKAKK